MTEGVITIQMLRVEWGKCYWKADVKINLLGYDVSYQTLGGPTIGNIIFPGHVKLKFHSNSALKTSIPKHPIILSKALAPFTSIFSAHNKVHFLTIYLLHFPKLYPLSNVPLPEG
jgi:hypothetical protein